MQRQLLAAKRPVWDIIRKHKRLTPIKMDEITSELGLNISITRHAIRALRLEGYPIASIASSAGGYFRATDPDHFIPMRQHLLRGIRASREMLSRIEAIANNLAHGDITKCTPKKK